MKKSDNLSKTDNRNTYQSQYSSEESCDFNGAFQFNHLLLPVPNKQKINLLSGNNKSSLKIRKPDDIKKPSIAFAVQPSNDNLLSVNEAKQHNQNSFIDIKISHYPSSGEVDSIKQVELEYNLNSKKSFQNLPSSGKIEANQLRKSQTQPKLVSVKEYEGFQIKTNYIQQKKDFKKQKNQPFSVHNSNNMTFLNATVSAKSNNMYASRVINDTRITLKDYMFMANTSSKQAAQAKRKELKQSKKLNTQPSTFSKKTNQSCTISNINIRQRFQKQKYHISNDQMGNIVKQSIQKELQSLKQKIQTINQWMNSHHKIQNQQLIQLYNIRRELQENNKKFDESFKRLNITQNRQFIQNICQMSMVQDQSNQNGESDIEMLTQI